MDIVKYIRKYKDFEDGELARRAAYKKKVKNYRNLVSEAKKKDLLRKKEIERLRAIEKKKLSSKRLVRQQPIFKKRKFSTKKFVNVIGNPYGTKI